MDKATLEAMAAMQGDNLDDIIYDLTQTDVTELRSKFESYMKKTSQKKRDRHSIPKFISWFEDNDADKIGSEEVEEFLRQMVKDGYAKSTVKNMYFSLTVFVRSEFSAMASSEVESVDRAEVVKSEFRQSRDDEDNGRMGDGSRPIKKDEIEQMLDASPTFRTEVMISILRETGLRAKELAELEMEDIKLDERTLTVNTAKRENHRRTISISLALCHKIRRYIETDRPRYGRASPYLFLTQKSDKPYPHNLARTIRNTAERAGIQSYNEMQNGSQRATITPHSFRKHVAIRMSREGKGPKEVAEFLGHSNTSSVDSYFDIQ
jgi:integrase